MQNQNKSQFENDRTTGSGQGTSARTARATEPTSKSEVNAATGEAESTIDKAKDTAKTMLDQAKTTASDAYGSVADKAASAIDEQKAGLTGGLTTAAETVRRVSGTISEGESQNGISGYAARYTETAAQKLEEAAHYFEANDLRAMARDVEAYARRNPAIFLGAAFALGILAARFIKSGPSTSADSNSPSAGEMEPGHMREWENRGFDEARPSAV